MSPETTLELDGLTAALEQLASVVAEGGDVEMVIGFGAEYAAAVHEVLTAHHDQGQAKYLEAAIRQAEATGLMGRAIALRLEGATTPAEIRLALVLGVRDAGLQILGDAQDLAPVDTGFLKASATWSGPDNRSGFAAPARERRAAAKRKSAGKGRRKK